MSKRTRGLRILALCASLVVALVGFAMPAHAATSLPEAKDGVITLAEDTTITSFPSFEGALKIDLAQHTLTYESGNTVFITNDKSLTFENGTLKAVKMANGTTSVFNIKSKGAVDLSGVTFITNGSALFPQGDAARVSVDNSSIYCGTFAVGTNAATAENYGVVIELTNSSFTTAYGYQNGDGDSAPVFVNIPCKMTMNGCTVNGARQGVVVRGGSAIINNCKINLTDTTKLVPEGVTGSMLNAAGKDLYLGGNWGGGNEVPMAAMVVGNRHATSYQYPTDVSVAGTIITAPEGYTTVYAFGSGEKGCEVHFAYDAASNVGTVVNPEGSVADAGLAVAQTGGRQYTSLASAIANAANGGTITMLSDVKDAEGIAVASGKNFTVDFDGHVYTIAGPGAGSPNTETNGFQLLKDSTIVFKNGTINTVENAPSKKIDRIIQNYADLTLENMRFETAGLASSEDCALSFNNANIVFKGDTSIVMSSPERIAFDVCEFSSYPSCVVTFDDTFTGNIGGQIMYDAKDAATHALAFKGDGTYAGVKVSKGSEDAAKDGIEIHKGTFLSKIDKDWIAPDAGMDVQPDGTVAVHVHKGAKVDAVAATCETAGNREHWKCTECGKTFSDDAMTDEIDVVVPAKGHNVKGAIHHKAVEPTTTDPGMLEHWECPDCHKLFRDAALTEVATVSGLTVPAVAVTKVTATFEAGNGVVYTQSVPAGSKLVCPETPVKDGWEFVGWFKTKAANGDVSDKWNFDEDVVTADITLYGGWVKKGAGQSGTSAQKPTAALPQTGDTSMLPIVVAGVAGVAAIGAGAVIIARRRKAE